MEGRLDTLKAFLFQGLWARVGGDKGCSKQPSCKRSSMVGVSDANAQRPLARSSRRVLPRNVVYGVPDSKK